jgi:hypothetical protein
MRASLSHRQAREHLALLLDATTEPELAGRVRQHVAGCARCQRELEQMRQAEAWFIAQPHEVPEMRAAQHKVWHAIQERIAAEDAPLPAAELPLANGHVPAVAHASSMEQSERVPRAAMSNDGATGAPDRLSDLSPALQPLAPVIAPQHFSKPAFLSPRKVLIAMLAASFIVGSFAALWLAHLSLHGASTPVSTALTQPSTDVLDPGNETLAFSFDPASRRLFALSTDTRADCPRGWHCPAPASPQCLRLSMLDAGTGKLLNTLLPACMLPDSMPGSTTFLDLFDDSDEGLALLIGSNQQVTALDSRSGATVKTYHLACCTTPETQPGKALLDQRDQLLLTTTLSEQNSGLKTLAAQNAATGQIKYQTPLDGSILQAALLSEVTGWLYLWTVCAADSSESCVEIYNAASGQKVSGWVEAFQAMPLAADPTESVLYVREDEPAGRSETLVVDGRSGQQVGSLPAAYAMAVNAPLHHAYLLDDNGATVIDTRTRRKLGTLPVPVHDTVWVAPAVDERSDRVYLPTIHGKLLIAQDNAAGYLSLGVPALQATLDAERAMVVSWEQGAMEVDPWNLPVGPGTLTFYYPLGQDSPGGCSTATVPARAEASATLLGGGEYSVQISMNWADPSPHADAPLLSGSPPALASYPHQHTWLYHISASGSAERSGEHGEAFSSC